MKKNEVFLLWIGDKVPELQQLSLKSFLLTGHTVKFYTYRDYDEIADLKNHENFQLCDANDIMREDEIWYYKVSNFGKGSVSGFSNLWRLKYLEKFGGTWVDSDVLAIRNIEEMYGDMPIVIGAEKVGTFKRGWDRPINALMSFPAHDPFVQKQIDISEEVGANAKHAETGPKLLHRLIKKEWSAYKRYVLDYRAVCGIIYTKSRTFITDTPEKIWEEQFMDTELVQGFHIWNTYFTVNTKKDHMKVTLKEESLYARLRDAINTSTTRDEYENHLRDIIPNFTPEITKKHETSGLLG